MTYAIDIQNEGEYPLDETRLAQAAAAVLAQQGAPPDAGLTIVVTSDAFVAEMNRQYRGISAPTDVLSFPADPDDPSLPDEEPPYLGDLLVAYPYAAAQAAREGHDLGDSLALLVVHGTLHLLGYDHDTAENRARMWSAQENALRALNIPVEIVPALEEAEHDDPQ